MERKVRIKEESVKRLQKDIELYEKERAKLEAEIGAKLADSSYYELRSARERKEETDRVLESTKAVLRKTEQELEELNK